MKPRPTPEASHVSAETRRLNPHLFPSNPMDAAETVGLRYMKMDPGQRSKCRSLYLRQLEALGVHHLEAEKLLPLPTLEEIANWSKWMREQEKKNTPKPRGRAPMNKTETAYSLILEARKRTGDIVDWEREGITLRWPDGMAYTPDFTVIKYVDDPAGASGPLVRILFVETKGPRIEEDALVKYRAARDKWGRFYRFEMQQLTKEGWNRIL